MLCYKTFSMQELLARVKANIRRSAPFPIMKIMLSFWDLSIDLNKYEVRKRSETIELTLRSLN